jgi:hypothetical protein
MDAGKKIHDVAFEHSDTLIARRFVSLLRHIPSN